MNRVAWMINRLRVMGAREIAHRANRALCQVREGRKIARGWRPEPATPAGPKFALFPAEGAVRRWHEYFSLDEAGLALLEGGRIDFFGHAPVDVGRPVRWHHDPLSGIAAPADSFGKGINYRDDALVGNVKVLWELGRHQHLVPLAVAYAVTGNQSYRDAVAEQIRGWIRDNPFGLGIHWCSALEAALRLISWAIVHSLFALRDGEEGLFGAVEGSEVGASIYQHAWFVAHFLSRHSSANNHLIGELTGLWTATQVFDLGAQGEKWGRMAQAELEQEALKQVCPDGVNREQATYYHLWVLEYFLFAALVGRRSATPFSPGFLEGIEAMAGFLRSITPEGGVPPQIGDADDGCVARFDPRWPQDPYGPVLAAAETLASGTAPTGEPSQKAFWYGLAAGAFQTNERHPVAKDGASTFPRAYSNGGYAVMGDADCRLVFDAGPLGYPSIAAHGHADALSFCLAVGGLWWLVDPGTYAYHSEPAWRNYFRGTSAHNTLLVNGQDQSRIGGPFLWTEHAAAALDGCGVDDGGGQWAQGHHTGYRRFDVTHRRRVVFDPSAREVQILDEIDGPQPRDVALFFHFAPEVTLEEGAAGRWLASRSASRDTLSLSVDPGWDWEVKRGSH
ncbi:alginate lyase family protein [Desulfuromonas sp.]|uniref:heparinase II/III family protein n=1 Tax=Desulfuromonas sp. TaxID=892 RepID=UPI0025BB7721|nr:alginate lyase family protein [Desulfuromonas sp.]